MNYASSTQERIGDINAGMRVETGTLDNTVYLIQNVKSLSPHLTRQFGLMPVLYLMRTWCVVTMAVCSLFKTSLADLGHIAAQIVVVSFQDEVNPPCPFGTLDGYWMVIRFERSPIFIRTHPAIWPNQATGQLSCFPSTAGLIYLPGHCTYRQPTSGLPF